MAKYTVHVEIHVVGIAIEADNEQEAQQKLLNLLDGSIEEPLEYSLGEYRAELLDVPPNSTVYVQDDVGDLVAYEKLGEREKK